MERVLFVVNGHQFGGLEVVLLDWLSGIDLARVSVFVCDGAELMADRLAQRGLSVTSLKPQVKAEGSFVRTFLGWWRVLRGIRPGKVVLLEGNLGDCSLAMILAARCSTLGPVFLFAGGGGSQPVQVSADVKSRLHFGFLPGIGLYRHRQSLHRRLRLLLVRCLFLSSEGLRRTLLASFGLSPRFVAALHHGVDIQRFKPSTAQRIRERRALGIPDTATVIVSHGRLARVKRVDRVLEAFRILAEEREDLWLLLTSYGPLKNEVENIVHSTKSFSRVKLVSFREDPSALLQASDIYVLASDREGFGIALVEAMASGLVCVATKCEGPSEILTNGKNGFLVEATEESVLSGLRQALSLDSQERQRLSNTARQTVADRFEIQNAIRTALAALEIPGR